VKQREAYIDVSGIIQQACDGVLQFGIVILYFYSLSRTVSAYVIVLLTDLNNSACGMRYNEKFFSQLTTRWTKALLEKLIVTQLVKKFPAFYGTRRLITASI